MEKDFTELDTMGNNRLKRLVLINYSDINLFINNKGYDLSEIILKDCNKMANSYQLSELNYEMKEFIIKPIVDIKEFDIEFFRKNKDILLTFEKNLKKLFDYNDNEYDNILKQLDNNFSYLKDYGPLNMNQINEYLNDIFKENEFLNEELFYNYCLLSFFYT